MYIRSLWSPAVHKLFTLVIRSSTLHGFARPTVLNRVVCLRQIFRSPLITIYSENELYRILLPAQPRAPNHSNFANSSTSNKGTHAPLLAPPQLQQQPLMPPLLQPSNFPPHQLQESTPSTSTSSSTYASIPPLILSDTPSPSTSASHATQTPFQRRLPDYSHLFAAPSTQQ